MLNVKLRIQLFWHLFDTHHCPLISQKLIHNHLLLFPPSNKHLYKHCYINTHNKFCNALSPEKHIIKKPTSTKVVGYKYGDGGIWTRVQRSWYTSFYVCSLSKGFASWKVINNQHDASLIKFLLNRLQTAVFSISY